MIRVRQPPSFAYFPQPPTPPLIAEWTPPDRMLIEDRIDRIQISLPSQATRPSGTRKSDREKVAKTRWCHGTTD
ncbi:hypothetical protein BD626DRAFT_472609 [Schizophyllum amplum]|uniref:Uncharacterized protein n=1 Tax=Schizophyllum amplum TaxID=97359 RepID=A0A550CW37_9AGAR|nr:hypothetical protein BD626DRAFT_472609 [Auriculariopsis ampla]